MIKAFLFDADGVVIHPWRFAALLDREYAITREMTRGFFTGVFEECLLGKADLKAVLPAYLAKWGWPGSVDTFVETWLEAENAPDERVLDWVQRLRASGFICALATLQERCRAAYMREVMGFTGLFDQLFFSCEIGLTKQDPAFYQHITQTLGLEPQEIFFWDDSEGNVEAARAAGLQAKTYTGFDSFSGWHAACLTEM